MPDAPNQFLRHGSAGSRVIGSPVIGSRFETSLLSIQVFPEQPYEVNFTSEEDVVTISFGLCTGVKAYDTDRRTALRETPETAYFHPAGSEIYVLAEKSAELLCFSFPSWIRKEILANERPALQTSITRTVEDIHSNYTAALAPVIRKFITTDRYRNSLEGEHLAIRFFEKLLHVATHADDSKLSPGLDKFRLRRVLEFIEDNLDHELSLKALSDVAALQVNHFARAFKQATHLPPHRYVLLRRLARAKELLSHTDESIAYIAYAVGFSSQAHFTAAFSRLAGMTPNVYRIEHRYRKHFFRLPAR